MLEPTTGPDLQSHLERCEAAIGHVFQNRDVLRAALTHASGADHRLESNERLEFLGDAILGAVVCEMLFHRFPDFLEGDLTKMKSVVVSRQTCARVSKRVGLQQFLFVGKGMTTSPRVPNSLLSDVFEALLAAIYLDAGIEPARGFVERFLGPEIDELSSGRHTGNFKSQLQQLAQREHSDTPGYRLLDEKGPDHSKCFKVAAMIAGRQFTPAWGPNKKEAEQRAASNALAEMNDEPPPFPEE